MTRYVAWRLASLAFVVLGITFLVFAMMAALPGDPATALLGPHATPERVAELNRQLGLEGSLPSRYAIWLGRLVQLDLGHSYSHERAVVEVLAERLGPTALLSAVALTFGSLLGLAMGSAAASRRGSLADSALRALSYVGVSTPAFWLAMGLMLLFGVRLGAFPVSGMTTSFVESPSRLVAWLDVAAHLALPAAALGLVVAGVIARLMRAAMLEVLSQPFVQLARAKGLDEGRVCHVHAFRVGLSRVVPVIGLQAGFVLGGAAYVEVVFQWPGVGKLLVDAILQRDLVLVQGVVTLLSVIYVLVNLVTDLAHRAIDPRVEA